MRANSCLPRATLAIGLVLSGCEQAPAPPPQASVDQKVLPSAPPIAVAAETLPCGGDRLVAEPGVVVRDARLLIQDQLVNGVSQTYLEAHACVRAASLDGKDHVMQGSAEMMAFDRDGHMVWDAGQAIQPFHSALALGGDTPQSIPNTRDALQPVGAGAFVGHVIQHYAVVPQVLFQITLSTCKADGTDCVSGPSATTTSLLNACVSDDKRAGQPIGACHDQIMLTRPPVRSVARGHETPARHPLEPKATKPARRLSPDQATTGQPTAKQVPAKQPVKRQSSAKPVG